MAAQVVQGAQRILGQAGAGAGAGGTEQVPLPTPPGLTPMDVKLVEGKAAPSGRAWRVVSSIKTNSGMTLS